MPHQFQHLGPSGPYYQNGRPVDGVLGTMTVGSGITAGAAGGAVVNGVVTAEGALIKTTYVINLKGLNSGGTDGDIMGFVDTANCHIGQWTTAVNGIYCRGMMSCAELVAGGEPDIDVYSATEATGVEDAAVSGLTAVALLAAAADWTQGAVKPFTGILAPNKYLYLVASGGATNATYTAGKFVLELYGIRG
jgi:hypothetical protein